MSRLIPFVVMALSLGACEESKDCETATAKAWDCSVSFGHATGPCYEGYIGEAQSALACERNLSATSVACYIEEDCGNWFDCDDEELVRRDPDCIADCNADLVPCGGACVDSLTDDECVTCLDNCVQDTELCLEGCVL